MSNAAIAKLSRLPPMQIGDVFTMVGKSDVFRVVDGENTVERFKGNRAQRRAKLSDWKAQAKRHG